MFAQVGDPDDPISGQTTGISSVPHKTSEPNASKDIVLNMRVCYIITW